MRTAGGRPSRRSPFTGSRHRRRPRLIPLPASSNTSRSPDPASRSIRILRQRRRASRSGRPWISRTAGDNWSAKNPICYQLEQRLVQEGQKSGQSHERSAATRKRNPALERLADQTARSSTAVATSISCSQRSLKNTPQCKDLARQSDATKRRLADLDARRQDILGSAGAPIRTTSSASLRATTAAPTMSTWPAATAAIAACGKTRNRAAATCGTPSCERGADVPDALRSPLRRLLFPGELLDAAEPFRAGCRCVHLEMRGADGVVLLSKPWRHGRAIRGAQIARALHPAQVRLPVPQGIRERLLVQGRRIRAAAGGWCAGQEGRRDDARLEIAWAPCRWRGDDCDHHRLDGCAVTGCLACSSGTCCSAGRCRRMADRGPTAVTLRLPLSSTNVAPTEVAFRQA